MIHASYIKHLEILDKMATDLITHNPFPIMYSDDITEKLEKINNQKREIVKLLANSLNMKVYETN